MQGCNYLSLSLSLTIQLIKYQKEYKHVTPKTSKTRCIQFTVIYQKSRKVSNLRSWNQRIHFIHYFSLKRDRNDEAIIKIVSNFLKIDNRQLTINRQISSNQIWLIFCRLISDDNRSTIAFLQSLAIHCISMRNVSGQSIFLCFI